MQYTQAQLIEFVLNSTAPRTKTRCKYCLQGDLEWVCNTDTQTGKTKWMLIGVGNDGTLVNHQCEQAKAAFKAKKSEQDKLNQSVFKKGLK